MKKGFTLVELSIVLVIIGLLVGGILVGQNLISSVKLNSLIRQIQQYDIAINNFRSKYKRLPGDANLLSPQGNANGWVEDNDVGSTLSYTHFEGEIMNFWAHLDQVNSLSDGKNYITTGTTIVTKGKDVHLPNVSYGTNSSIIAFGNASILYGMQYMIGNFDGHTIASRFRDTGYPRLNFKPAELAALDAKLDDGIVNRGFVYASSDNDGLGSSATANCFENVSGTLLYKVDNDVLACTARIKMFAQIGMQDSTNNP